MTEGRKKKLVRILKIQLIVLVVWIVCAEILARLFFAPPQFVLGLPYDPDLGFTPAPRDQLSPSAEGHVEHRTNSLGFRGPELPGSDRPAPAGTSRVLFVGDSFLDGWGVRMESLIPFSAESALNERGLAIESYSFSGTGYGTAQELMMLREHAADVRPDVVVLVMYPGNDLVNNTIEMVGRTKVSPGDYVRPFLVADGEGGLRRAWIHPFRGNVRRWSHAFAVLEHRLLRGGVLELPVSGEAPLLGWSERALAGLLPRSSDEILLESGPSGPWDLAWTRTEDIVRAFRDDVEGMDAAFLVVVIPTRLQVQRDAALLWLEWLVEKASGASIDSRVDWNLPERRLAAFFRDEGIDAVLLVDALRDEVARTERSVYLNNHHMNGLGNEVAGRLTADAVERRLGARDIPAIEAPTGAPVELAKLVFEDASHVDFTEGAHPEVLCTGWNWYSVPAKGWVMGRSGTVLLPSHSGWLVARGYLPDYATFPVELSVHVANFRLEPDTVVEAPGDFEIRVQVPEPPPGFPPYMPVRLGASVTSLPPWGGTLRVGMVLRSIGIE